MNKATNDFPVEELPPSGYAQWDAFVETSVEKSPFSKLAWLEAFTAASARNSFSISVVRSKSGDIAAGVALLQRITPVGTANLVIPDNVHPQNSILFKPLPTEQPNRIYSHRQACASALIQHLQKRSYGSIRLIHHPAVMDVRPFIWSGWTIKPRYTFLIDLPAFGGVESFTPQNRARYRKCSTAEFRVATFESVIPHVNTFLNLLAKTYHRQGLGPDEYGMHEIPIYLKHLAARERLLYFEARDQADKPLAARLVVPATDGTVYDWLAATDPEFLKTGVTAFLIGEMLAELQRREFSRFDFGGANAQKIAEFKQGFNGELIRGYETYWESRSLRHRLVRNLGSSAYRLRKVIGGMKKQDGNAP